MNTKDLIFLTFCVLIPKAIFSQITNEGTLQIEPSTVVYFENEYTNQATGIHNNDGDLYFNSSFINDGLTASSSGTTFFKSAVNNILTIGGAKDSIQFYNLEVNVYGASKKGVYVNNNLGLVVANKLNLVSGDLRLAAEAQVVQTHTGANLNTNGTGKLLRDQQGTTNVYGYNYWSSPVNNISGSFSLNGGLYDGADASINTFSPQQVLFNSGAPYNGVPSVLDGSGNVTTPLYINDRWLYIYPQSDLGYNGWQKIDKNTLITPGLGFSMKGTGVLNQNYVFKGVPNNGDYSFPILTGETIISGNPYPSAIDANKLIQDNLSVFDNIQFWVDGGSNSHILSDYQGGYSVYNLTGGVAPSIINAIGGLGSSSGIIPKRYIGVAQGFAIEAIGDGNIIFKNSQRTFKVEDLVNSNFYKSSNYKASKGNETNSFIRIGYEDPELFHRQLLLGFLPDSPADLDLNLGYDACINDPREDELFYIIENDVSKKYIIQGVGAYSDTYEFPLGLIISQTGTHTINLDAVENFTDTVYIEDTVLNTYYNLSNSNLSLNLPPGNYYDRFKVVFKSGEALNVESSIENNMHVFYKTDNIIITNQKSISINDVLIFNMLGEKIIDIKNERLKEKQIHIPFNYTQGMYLVIINSNQGSKTFKIIN